MSTFDLIMSTLNSNQDLAAILFGKTRRALLGHMLGHPDQAYYLRQLMRLINLGHGSVQRELKELVRAKILTQRREGNQLYYQANTKSPIYAELKSIILKTSGLSDILKISLQSLSSKIEIAFVYGSVAKNEETANSDIDLFVIGDVSFKDLLRVLQSAQNTLQREINPSIYSSKEYHQKINSGHHFLNSLIKSPKIFILGDSNELKKLGSKRLASHTQDKSSRN